jgi:2-C-methyl-D-erythritol 4-phosphate cytidylyltransferase
MKKYVIVVAGGTGQRMNSDIPKQFLLLAHKPVLMHTIQRFYAFDSEIDVIVVLPQEQFNYWEKLCLDYDFSIPHRVTAGGVNRFRSVKNGLALINESGIVAIHDGVRPFVSIETIEKTFHKASIFGAAIPVRDMVESLRYSNGGSNYAFNRDFLKVVQTPQVFKTDLLIEAYANATTEDFTDDATVVERAGKNIVLVNGNPENIKITTPLDLLIGEKLLS